MVTIKVILLGSNNFFAFMKHIAAIVTDVETGRQFLVNYPFGSYDNQDPRASQPKKAMWLYRAMQGGFCAQVVYLSSDRNYDEFIQEFRGEQASFSWLGHNCAKTINDMLDYFFPQAVVSSLTLLARLVNSCSMPMSFFMPVDFIFSALLMAKEVKTPANIFTKAAMIAEQYPCNLAYMPMNVPEIATAESDNSPETLDEYVINNVYAPLRLI